MQRHVLTDVPLTTGGKKLRVGVQSGGSWLHPCSCHQQDINTSVLFHVISLSGHLVLRTRDTMICLCRSTGPQHCIPTVYCQSATFSLLHSLPLPPSLPDTLESHQLGRQISSIKCIIGSQNTMKFNQTESLPFSLI